MRRFFSLKTIVIIVILFDLAVVGRLGLVSARYSIPDEIQVFKGREAIYDFSLPVKMSPNNESKEQGELKINGEVFEKETELDDCMAFSCDTNGNYHATVSLLGIYDLKEIDIKVSDPIELYPVGKCSGIYVKTDGIMVLGVGSIECGTSKKNSNLTESPATNIVKPGDYITQVNYNDVNSYEDMIEYIQNSDEDKIILTIRRNSEIMDVAINRVLALDGEYKLGVWVRENLQGIGTITFVDQSGGFGALGHGITDSVNGIIMEIEGGELYSPYIKEIIKGRKNSPGELYGVISYNDKDYLGNIISNEETGIYGKVDKKKYYENIDDLKLTQIKLKDEIDEGPAKIICNVGNERKEYDIEIKQVNMNGDKNKNMIIKITDDELLSLTNGIVQGMSGSPIIQDGKLIGAVTHVFVDNPKMGYGIFIENMLY